MWRVGSLLVVCLIVLGSCSLMTAGPTLKGRLDTKLRTGLKWKIRVNYWQNRLDDPYVESDTPVVATVRYRVLETPPEESGRRILVRTKSFEGLLSLNTAQNVTFASRIVSRRSSGLVKTQQILDNPFGNRAFFAPNWAPSRAIFWFHPDMTVRSTRRLFAFETGGANRIVQTTHCREDRCRIRLSHQPTLTTVTFVWSKGEPWWDRAEWYRSDRLVAFARRIK